MPQTFYFIYHTYPDIFVTKDNYLQMEVDQFSNNEAAETSQKAKSSSGVNQSTK